MSSFALRTFSRGEIAPGLYARTDLAAYASGLKTCRNFIVRRTGGVDSRPGTELVGVTSLGRTWLYPFVFNASQSYILEFSALTIRFIRSGGYVGGSYSIVTPYTSDEVSALQLSQSADVVTITHANHAPMELRRLADANWTLTPVTFGPMVATVTGVNLSPWPNPGTGGINWSITALGLNGEEGYQSTTASIGSLNTSPTTHQITQITWTPVATAVGYNIYKSYGTGGWGLVGTSVNPSFIDAQLVPDFFTQPPVSRALFSVAGDYPTAVGSYQQRRILAGALNTPETVYTSRAGNTRNFTTSTPTQDDDAITFTPVGDQVNAVQFVIDAGELILCTSGAMLLVEGDGAGVLRPTAVNVRQISEFGCGVLRPIISGSRRLLFVEARQTIVRDLARDPYVGHKGSDLTLFSSHLFEGHTLTSWTYQKTPHALIWATRDDGVLVCLTDVPDQDVLGWHRHDTLGTVECVCAIPEGNEDRLYLVVLRNGVRCVERLASRYFASILSAITTDSTLSFDGRNANASASITLSTAGGWTTTDTITCTSTTTAMGGFSINDAVVLTALDGSTVTITLNAITGASTATGHPNKTVPVSLRGVGTAIWSRAVPSVSGLSHLEGRSLSVFADGFVVANPNNPAISTTCVVTGGVITLDRPYSVIHAGLPYVCDLLTLDLDTPQGASLRDKKVLINKVILEVIGSRGFFAGGDAPSADNVTDGLFEFPIRDTENYSDPITLYTGVARVNIENNWNQDRNGRVFIRQVDPVPLTVLAVIPTGMIPPGTA